MFIVFGKNGETIKTWHLFCCRVHGCCSKCLYPPCTGETEVPGWKMGFSSCIHPSLNRRRIGLCKQHLKDLYPGRIYRSNILMEKYAQLKMKLANVTTEKKMMERGILVYLLS